MTHRRTPEGLHIFDTSLLPAARTLAERLADTLAPWRHLGFQPAGCFTVQADDHDPHDELLFVHPQGAGLVASDSVHGVVLTLVRLLPDGSIVRAVIAPDELPPDRFPDLDAAGPADAPGPLRRLVAWLAFGGLQEVYANYPKWGLLQRVVQRAPADATWSAYTAWFTGLPDQHAAPPMDLPAVLAAERRLWELLAIRLDHTERAELRLDRTRRVMLMLTLLAAAAALAGTTSLAGAVLAVVAVGFGTQLTDSVLGDDSPLLFAHAAVYGACAWALSAPPTLSLPLPLLAAVLDLGSRLFALGLIGRWSPLWLGRVAEPPVPWPELLDVYDE